MTGIRIGVERRRSNSSRTAGTGFRLTFPWQDCIWFDKAPLYIEETFCPFVDLNNQEATGRV